MLIATDLDGSLAHGTRDNILELNSIFKENNFTVVYVTGRDLKKFRELTKTVYKEMGVKLYPPHYLVTLNGIRIYQFRRPYLLPFKRFWRSKHWPRSIKNGWSKKKCYEAFQVASQKHRFSNDLPAIVDVRYKPTAFHLETCVHCKSLDVIKQTIEEECALRNTKVNVIFDYLEKHYVDLGLKVLDAIDRPKADIIREMRDETEGLYVSALSATTKGEAVDYLRKKIGLQKYQVIAAGDGGNDLQLLTKGFNSIVVKNAHPILLKAQLDKLSEEEKTDIIFVESEGAKGLLEGIKIVLDKSFPHSGDGGLRSVINA